MRSRFNKISTEKNTLEMHAEMSEIVVIIDNNNFAPSTFSHCVKSLVIVFGPWYFFWELHSLRKNLDPQE